MGLFSRKPKIKIQSTKKDGYSGWVQCSGCTELIHANELEKNLHCCPKCDHHYRFSLENRLASLADEDTAEERFDNLQSVDALEFVDTETYPNRLKKAEEKSSRKDAVWVGTVKMNGNEVALGVMDFSFMGGSMGSVVGEKITSIIEYAIEYHLPVVLVSTSGGARMQESIFSLMQMAKTSAALSRLHEAKLPYISVVTNPTTGGVTASFASLGDIIIAEPNALIAFAGPRVVEQTIGQKLPPGAQKSEFLLEKGMIDCIVSRKNLKEKISYFIEFLNIDRLAALEEKFPERLKELLQFAENSQKNEENQSKSLS